MRSRFAFTVWIVADCCLCANLTLMFVSVVIRLKQTINTICKIKCRSLALDEQLHRRWVTQKSQWAGTATIGAGLKYRYQVSGFGNG